MKTTMSSTYNVHEAKTHLSRLLERASGGEEIIIAKAGVPVARLVPIVLPSRNRVLGTEKGLIVIAPDFDAELPEDSLASFET